MGALTDLSDLVNRLTGGNSGTPEHAFFYKLARVAGAAATAPVAGRFTSMWRYDGFPGAPAATPGTTWVNPTNATAGSLQQADPGGGRQKWLLGAEVSGIVQGSFLIYDRLAHVSGMNGTLTTAQTGTGTGSVSRYTLTAAAGNMAFVEVYTAIGATGTTATVSYNDEGGNASTTPAFAIGATGLNEAQRMIPIPLASGDRGIRQINSITLAATTGTAGDFGITIARPLAMLHVVAAGTGAMRDMISGFPSAVECPTGACLSIAFLANTTTIPDAIGGLHFVEA